MITTYLIDTKYWFVDGRPGLEAIGACVAHGRRPCATCDVASGKARIDRGGAVICRHGRQMTICGECWK